ncbi:MAG: HAD superfamily P-type ATPase [Promethearchaeota archaeon CR_4]|nr:MAG: HAD superfamily P-type ATPase [Candidatus Lokiarchaeota archaeon CR_4]
MQGLTRHEYDEKLQEFSYNEIPEERQHPLRLFFRKFIGTVSFVIELSIIIALAIGKVVEASVMFSLLMLNAVISFAQEYKAERVVALLKSRISINAQVLREGIWTIKPAREIVPSDIVKIMLGNVVPADVRILEGDTLIDQSTITGESIPVEKRVGDILYAGSFVVRGEVFAEVIATGSRTYFGKTAQLLHLPRVRLIIEDITLSVSRFLVILSTIFMAIIVVHFALTNVTLADALPILLSLLIASIPVALPAMSAVALSIGALQLARQGVIVKKFNAVEAAAMMEIACLDKTGTITENRLAISDVLVLNSKYTKTDVLQYATLASEQVTLDPIDKMIRDHLQRLNIPQREGVTVKQFKPFDPHTKRAEATILEKGISIIVAKGAPQVFFPTPEERRSQSVLEINERLAHEGNRVLAITLKINDNTDLVGLLVFRDPPREDSGSLISKLRALGIRVMMITGDNVAVARSIATQVGIEGPVVKIKDIPNFPQPDVLPILETSVGIAEVVPEDKYRIIDILQSTGHHIVGMTGDGVNDAPALRKAEVGIAVNHATDVARSSAEIILTQEGIQSIVNLVSSGRVIYRRIITWILNKIIKTFEIVFSVSLATLILGQMILTSVQMLLILFLYDFVTIAISVDNVSPSPVPEKWNLRKMILLPVLLGVANLVEFFLAFGIGAIYFGLSAAEIQSFAFYLIFIAGLMNLLVIRERSHFWKSRPVPILLAILVTDFVGGTIIASTGFLMAPLPLPFIVFLLLFEVVFVFLLNDYIKIKIETFDKNEKKPLILK